MSGMSLIKRLEVETTHEWNVLMTNTPTVMGSGLISDLVRLISRKTGIEHESIMAYFQEKSLGDSEE